MGLDKPSGMVTDSLTDGTTPVSDKLHRLAFRLSRGDRVPATDWPFSSEPRL